MAATIGRREIPVIIIFVLSMMMIIPFFLNIPPLAAASAEIKRMLVPMAGCAGILGANEVIGRHIIKVQKKREGWEFSIVLVASFIFFFVVSLLPGLEGLFRITYITIIGRVNESVFALIALFMATMAYRAFRMKNIETALFGLSCLIVLIANAPILEAFWPGGSAVRDWLMDVVNMAAMRAVGIGVALGIFAYGVRTMLGYERIALGEFEIRKRS